MVGLATDTIGGLMLSAKQRKRQKIRRQKEKQAKKRLAENKQRRSDEKAELSNM